MVGRNGRELLAIAGFAGVPTSLVSAVVIREVRPNRMTLLDPTDHTTVGRTSSARVGPSIEPM